MPSPFCERSRHGQERPNRRLPMNATSQDPRNQGEEKPTTTSTAKATTATRAASERHGLVCMCFSLEKKSDSTINSNAKGFDPPTRFDPIAVFGLGFGEDLSVRGAVSFQRRTFFV